MTIDKKSISDKQENNVRICRGKHDRENPYVMISKEMLRDPELSVRDKGILCYLLSFPDDWITNPSSVAKALGIARSTIYLALSKLIELGYATKEEIKDSKGRFSSVIYSFYEIKLENPQKIKEKITVSEKPYTEKPDTENRTHTNKEEYTKNEEEKKKETHPLTPEGEKTKPAKAGVVVGFGEIVKLTEEDHAKLCSVHGAAVMAGLIEEMNDHCLAKGVRYKDYAAALRNWLRKRQNAPVKDRKFAPSSDQNQALKNIASMRETAL
jgi:predicted transcriptional regulator